MIALLICGSPKAQGPVVRLPAGRHIIHIRGLLDSALHVSVDGVTLDIWDGAELTLPNFSNVQVLFARRGNENGIDVFARMVA